ncbi:hypothetical protein GALMADRAFT_138896 [Galerina marginata CBS 339.88]|uniref:Uncharacterized protein n=1 Tax=Galerina marginata (strain CBS 339.88) TaxID=685588 RepID=A0A067T672_GALM3|nr:hypothetical protein GALMADRAFT_138896 [Galerina marginata CBS 339.88]
MHTVGGAAARTANAFTKIAFAFVTSTRLAEVGGVAKRERRHANGVRVGFLDPVRKAAALFTSRQRRFKVARPSLPPGCGPTWEGSQSGLRGHDAQGEALEEGDPSIAHSERRRPCSSSSNSVEVSGTVNANRSQPPPAPLPQQPHDHGAPDVTRMATRHAARRTQTLSICDDVCVIIARPPTDIQDDAFLPQPPPTPLLQQHADQAPESSKAATQGREREHCPSVTMIVSLPFHRQPPNPPLSTSPGGFDTRETRTSMAPTGS